MASWNYDCPICRGRTWAQRSKPGIRVRGGTPGRKYRSCRGHVLPVRFVKVSKKVSFARMNQQLGLVRFVAHYWTNQRLQELHCLKNKWVRQNCILLSNDGDLRWYLSMPSLESITGCALPQLTSQSQKQQKIYRKLPFGNQTWQWKIPHRSLCLL